MSEAERTVYEEGYARGFKEGVLAPSTEAKHAERKRILSILETANINEGLQTLIDQINHED